MAAEHSRSGRGSGVVDLYCVPLQLYSWFKQSSKKGPQDGKFWQPFMKIWSRPWVISYRMQNTAPYLHNKTTWYVWNPRTLLYTGLRFSINKTTLKVLTGCSLLAFFYSSTPPNEYPSSINERRSSLHKVLECWVPLLAFGAILKTLRKVWIQDRVWLVQFA